jgi:abequosyltransferase
VAHRYFPEARYFPPGAESIVTFFRRSIVVSGLTLHRDNSALLQTSRFDGTLLYQLYLVGMLMSRGTGLFLPEILVLARAGNVPFFGSSPLEPNFTPGQITPESVTAFTRGMLVIGAHIEQQTGMKVRRGILRDLGNYSYPTLRIQAHRSRRVYLAYVASIMRLGLWSNPLPWAYASMLTILGPSRSDTLIERIQTRAKVTPRIGNFAAGRSMPPPTEWKVDPETEAKEGPSVATAGETPGQL